MAQWFSMWPLSIDRFKSCLFEHVMFLILFLPQFLHLEMENDNNDNDVILHTPSESY